MNLCIYFANCSDTERALQQRSDTKNQTDVQAAPQLHELLSEWTFWFVYTLSHREKNKLGKKARFNEYQLHEVFSFGTVEDFWKMYNNTYQISEIIPNTDYLLLKKGIRPEWEDPYNKQGGKWVVTLPIEEDMEECNDACIKELINGAIFSIRGKHYRISLWYNDNNNIPKAKRIGNKFKDVCQLPEKFIFSYQLYQKALMHELDNEAFITLKD